MNKEYMISLYNSISKHSGYQILPSEIRDFLGTENTIVSSRHEKERFEFINNEIDFSNKNVMDIGGNTGYFTFEALKAGAAHLDYYEGNAKHSEFVALASELYGTEKVSVYNEYFDFSSFLRKYDIIMCLNVIHHLGDDFFDDVSLEAAKVHMMDCINNLAKHTAFLVFQMGFNWKGNIKFPIFHNGTKEELIDFVNNNTKDFWDIQSIGIAENNREIKYHEISKENIKRIDVLGEFLNRPIFIMRSKL